MYILPLLSPSSEDDCLGVLLGLLTAAHWSLSVSPEERDMTVQALHTTRQAQQEVGLDSMETSLLTRLCQDTTNYTNRDRKDLTRETAVYLIIL